MLILTDCLTEKIDEGCLKVANSLIKRIKSEYSDTTVASYKQKSDLSDVHLNLNRFFLNRSLFSLIKKTNQPVLYIPFASNTTASAIRTFVLSLAAKKGLRVIFALRYPMSKITKALLKISGAEIVALSRESYDYFVNEIGSAAYLKTGIDTKKFAPADNQKKQELRKKYDVADGQKVVLHVGHLKSGRNVDKLLNVDERFHVFLVASTLTDSEKDGELRKKLQSRPNTTIIETYLEHIEEIYQLADVYMFPVQAEHNCIDVPLSVLEAAACNLPIVTTDFGELKEFTAEPGFCFIESFDKANLNAALAAMADMPDCNNRKAVLEYDWERSVQRLMINWQQ